jgi:hypothetical protein
VAILDGIAKQQSTGKLLKESIFLIDLLVFFAVAFVVLWLNWSLINVNHYEAGDFAANSLLIQKAKRFDLFVGNYSRVGFHHPGPAILYVLALGEAVLFDWAHAVPSPFSGQMVAAILYNAAWIAVIFRMLRKISGSVTFAGFVTAAFLCIVSIQNYQFFAGMWFPELYFFPFAAALIAASRFASGKTDMLIALALSAGFLINGHVSFVSTLGIIFVLLVLYNRLAHRRLDRSQYFFDEEYWKINSRPIAWAIFVLFLFFIPLIVETVRHFPGPVGSYIAVGSHHHANSIRETIKYSGQFWGGSAAFIFATLCMIAFLAHGLYGKRKLVSGNILALLASLVAATAAMLFYSRFGVDMLDQKYIGYFYYSVPALTASLLVAEIVRACVPRFFAIPAIIAIPVLLIITAKEINRPPAYTYFYDQPDVAQLYNSIVKEKPAGRLVFNLDSKPDPAYIWAFTLGLEVYAARLGNDLFCINQGWHISYTTDARCTPDELANNTGYEVSTLTPGDHATTDIEGAGLLLRKYPDDFSRFGFVSAEKSPVIFGSVLDSGWSAVESQSVWMQSKEAHLLIKVRNGFSGTLQLDLGAFLPYPNSVQHLDIYVDNVLAYRTIFDAKASRQTLRIPVQQVKNGHVDVKFVAPDIVSPKALGLSDDPRTLGVSLYGFGLAE